jgi:hypothetical protein
MTLEDLLTEFGPEAVISANGGNIPSTAEEIDAVWQVLKINHQ